MEKVLNKEFLENLRGSDFPLFWRDLDPLLQKCGGPSLDFLAELIDRDIVPSEKACRLWADGLGVAYVNPLVAVVTEAATSLLPHDIARKALAVGLYIINGVLTLAMATPDDSRLIKQIEGITGCKVSPVFSPPREIIAALELYYNSRTSVTEEIEKFEIEQRDLLGTLTDDDLSHLAGSDRLSNLLDGILFFGMREKASDIHMEATEDGALVRFRIDGKLSVFYKYGKAIHRAFLTRLKVLCKLNIAESRFPQDGRFSMPFGMGRVDFRVSVIPAVEGGKAVIRILSGVNQKSLLNLDQMTMSKSILDPMRRLIKSPNGLFFVTGPTGSGKTTTLYAVLSELNSPERNICTIEDPVEIKLPGINQVQVNSHIDLNFGLLLRSLLRQDPDIILVGEIRDKETAKIGVEAALTGHLVLSTLHTNNAIQAIVRLMEIGIEPYMVAPSILGVLSQRLAARICEGCKRAYFPSRDLMEQYFTDIPPDDEITFSHGIGCVNCRQTGYSGRIAFHELLLVDDEFRSMISRSAGLHDLLAYARRLGYRSLRYDALKKVLLGLTTIEEVEKHTVVEWES